MQMRSFRDGPRASTARGPSGTARLSGRCPGRGTETRPAAGRGGLQLKAEKRREGQKKGEKERGERRWQSAEVRERGQKKRHRESKNQRVTESRRGQRGRGQREQSASPHLEPDARPGVRRHAVSEGLEVELERACVDALGAHLVRQLVRVVAALRA